MTRPVLIAFLTLVVLACGQPEPGPDGPRYPNELPGYHLYEGSRWSEVEFGKSTLADVRRILGKPDAENDLEDLLSPYPGDDAVRLPAFTYDDGEDWTVHVYFQRADGGEHAPWVASSLDFTPARRIPFGDVEFPAAFVKKHVETKDGAWDRFADGTGLSYRVCTRPWEYSEERPGDLSHIEYGPAGAPDGE